MIRIVQYRLDYTYIPYKRVSSGRPRRWCYSN